MTQFIKMAALALVVLGGSLIQAEPIVPTNEPEKPAVKVDPNAPITDVRLGEILEGMGLELKKGTYKSGAAYFDITVSGKDFDVPVRLGLSPNKRAIWLMVSLGELPADTPAERYKALLEAINSKTGKMQFRLVGNYLKADQPMDNVAVTPARLRKEIDDIVQTVQETENLWNPKKWQTPAAKAEPK